ncbi:MAG TPA: alpha-galactosidase [Acidimicrobiales bacterium]|nr:alpha-galactosidase [Acidimicrobiales bacterium]
MTGVTEPLAVAVNGHEAPFAEGVATVGDLEVEVRSADVDGGRRLDLTVRNPGRRAVGLRDVVVRLAARPERVLEHGHQGASVVRRCAAGDVRPERVSLPAWVRATYFTRPEAAGRVVSGDQFLLTDSGVAGFLDARRHLGTVEADPAGLLVRALFDGVAVEPGAERVVEPVWLADGDPGARYTDFASLWGLTAGARITSPSPMGWSGRHQYAGDLTPEDVRVNLKVAADRGLEVVQIDGYQAALGDWLTGRSAWGDGAAAVAAEIRAVELRAGLCTSPFEAADDSEVLRRHPEWALVGTGDPAGSWWALDTTRPDVLDHLRHTFATLTEQGFDYHRLGGCVAAALPARRHDPTRTRAEALRAGLDAVREGIGDRGLMLAADCPLGPAVGVVDTLAVGPEVAPWWAPVADHGWPGLAESTPAVVNAVAAAVLRSPLHRRLFVNDPGCLLLRPTDTGLEARQRSLLATVITGTGAFTVVSDDLGRYTELEWALLEALRSVHTVVDTLLEVEDPFADPVVVRSAAGTRLSVDWRAGAPGGAVAELSAVEDDPL